MELPKGRKKLDIQKQKSRRNSKNKSGIKRTYRFIIP